MKIEIKSDNIFLNLIDGLLPFIYTNLVGMLILVILQFFFGIKPMEYISIITIISVVMASFYVLRSMFEDKMLIINYRTNCSTCFDKKYQKEMHKFVDSRNQPHPPTYICKSCIKLLRNNKK